MKNLNAFLKESQETQSETLQSEIGQILRPFGSIRNGFKKKFDFDKIDELMTQNGWNYIDNEEDENRQPYKIYKWEKVDYICYLYVNTSTNTIKNFQIMN